MCWHHRLPRYLSAFYIVLCITIGVLASVKRVYGGIWHGRAGCDGLDVLRHPHLRELRRHGGACGRNACASIMSEIRITCDFGPTL